MSRSKKILSIVLTVIMAVSMLVVAPASASAAENVRINEVYPEVGQKILYDFYVQTSSTVSNMEGRLNYDPSVLALEDLKFDNDNSFQTTFETVDGVSRVNFKGTKATYDTKSSRVVVCTAIFSVKAVSAKYTALTTDDAVSACFTSLVSSYGEDLMKNENTNITTRTIIAPTSVTMAKSSVLLDRGAGDSETVKVKAVGPVNDSEISSYLCTSKSSNTKVCKVNTNKYNGVKITAVGPGTATVTVTTDGGLGKATIKVTVKQPVKKVALSKTSVSLASKGKTVTLKATATPSNASNKKLNIKSSNTGVATVSAKTITSGKTFKVTAKKKGTATITATAADGSKKSAKCKVTVKK